MFDKSCVRLRLLKVEIGGGSITGFRTAAWAGNIGCHAWAGNGFRTATWAGL